MCLPSEAMKLQFLLVLCPRQIEVQFALLNQYLYFSVKDSESDIVFIDCFAGKIANLHSKDAITFYVSESYKSVTKKGHFYGFVILCPLRELLT